MNEALRMHGAMTAHLFKADGTVQTTHKDNMIVNVGFDFIANAIGATTSRPNIMRYIAVGTGTTAVQATQTALATQLAIKDATYAHLTSTKTFTFTVTYNPGEATGAITEAGVLIPTAGLCLTALCLALLTRAQKTL